MSVSKYKLINGIALFLVSNNYRYVKFKSLRLLLLYGNGNRIKYSTIYPGLKVIALLLFAQTAPERACMCLTITTLKTTPRILKVSNNYVYVKFKSLCLLFLYCNGRRIVYCTTYPSLKEIAPMLFAQTSPECACV